MNKEQTAIGPGLYFSLLLIATISYGLMNLPHYAALFMGPNGYLGEVIAAILILPGIIVIYLLAKRFPGQTIIEQGQSILGPFFGRVTGAVYLLFSLVMLTAFTRDMINLAGNYYLNHSPVFAVTLLCLPLIAYGASRGIETISRLAAFIVIPGLIVLFGLTLLGFQHVKWTHVAPLASPNITDYFKGGLAVVYIYYILASSAISLPFLKPLKTFPRVAGGALLFAATFFAIFALGSIGVFGSQYIDHYSWPGVEFIRGIDYPYLLLEQAGLLLLIDWVALIMVGSAYLYYTIALGASQVTGLFGYKRWVWILFPLIYLLMIFPRDVTTTKKMLDFIAAYGWMILFAYPVALWLAAVCLRRKGQPVG